MILYNRQKIGNPIQIEYYDRQRDYHGVGTFIQLNDLPIEKGQLFIVPARDNEYNLILDTKERDFFKVVCGCREGRTNHPAYLKPIALTCRAVGNEHISTEQRVGAYRKDLCYIELDSLDGFETIPD